MSEAEFPEANKDAVDQRWDTKIKCPKKCGGTLMAFVQASAQGRALHHFDCTECNLAGTWAELASRRRRRN